MRGALHDRHVRLATEEGLFAEAVRPLTGLRRDPGEAFRQAQIDGRAVPDLATLPEKFAPLLEDLLPVMQYLRTDRTDLTGFIQALGQSAAEVAPVAAEQADLFAQLDRTFGALAEVARPFIQDTIAETPPTFIVAEETMRALGIDEVEICPWALREGAILRRLDRIEDAPAG